MAPPKKELNNLVSAAMCFNFVLSVITQASLLLLSRFWFSAKKGLHRSNIHPVSSSGYETRLERHCQPSMAASVLSSLFQHWQAINAHQCFHQWGRNFLGGSYNVFACFTWSFLNRSASPRWSVKLFPGRKSRYRPRCPDFTGLAKYKFYLLVWKAEYFCVVSVLEGIQLLSLSDTKWKMPPTLCSN